jgi:hypothetical protein
VGLASDGFARLPGELEAVDDYFSVTAQGAPFTAAGLGNMFSGLVQRCRNARHMACARPLAVE